MNYLLLGNRFGKTNTMWLAADWVKKHFKPPSSRYEAMTIFQVDGQLFKPMSLRAQRGNLVVM